MHLMPPPPENNTAANTPASSPLIVADNISAYRRGFAVVRDVSLQVERGDFTTIVGPQRRGQNHPAKMPPRLVADRFRKPCGGRKESKSATRRKTFLPTMFFR